MDTIQQHPTDAAAATETTIQKYLNSLSPKEYKAYMIAKSHLESSFDMEKSIGYTQFVKNKPSYPISVSPIPPLNLLTNSTPIADKV